MIKKIIPVASTPRSIPECFYFVPRSKEKLEAQMISFFREKHIFFSSSGLASFYIILEALKKLGPNKEVVLPAYTAASLVVAVKKAGLIPVLCDINLKDFNIDCPALDKAVSKNTLAILGVHMYGIPMQGLQDIKARFPGVWIIEDCAQSFGSTICGGLVGSFGDVSFFSFNKGKNTPSCGGGAIITEHEEVARCLKIVMDSVAERSFIEKIFIPIMSMAVSFAVHPIVYGTLYGFISCFKDMAPPKDVYVKKYTAYQAGLELRVLEKLGNISEKRYADGMRLIDGLKGLPGVKLPEIPDDARPAFNRMPVVFKDTAHKDSVKKALWDAGIEANELYYRPVHHIFDLGYKRDEFPNAVYLAERLLTLPVHTGVRVEDIDRMIETIKQIT